jgi:hypothetical protein
MSVFRCVLFGGLMFMLGACTRVSIHESDGRVRVVKGFGLIRIDAEPRSQPQLIQENSFGIVRHANGWSLGYPNARRLLLPAQDCRIVVWVSASTRADTLEQIGQLPKNICRADARR